MTPKERAELLNELIAKAANQNGALTARQQQSAWRQIEQTKNALTDALMRASTNGTDVQRERLSSLLDSLRQIERLLQETALNATTAAITAAASRTTETTGNAFDGAGIPTLGMDFNRINADVVKYVVQRFGEDGLVLSDRLWQFAGNQRAQLENVLKIGITTGKSISEMRRDIEAVYNQNRYVVDRLIKTEMNTAYRVTMAYSANESELVEYVRIVRGRADRPEHRCTVLSKQDNYDEGAGVFKTTDTEIYNPHPNCTSYLLYVLNEPKTAAATAIQPEPESRTAEPSGDDDFESAVEELITANTPKDVEKVLRKNLPELKVVNLKAFDYEFAMQTGVRLLNFRRMYPEVFGTMFAHFEDMHSAYTRFHNDMLRRMAIRTLESSKQPMTEKTITELIAQLRKSKDLPQKLRVSKYTNGIAFKGTIHDNERGIYINRKISSDYSYAAKLKRLSKEIGWSSSDEPVGTVTHEFGHMIDFWWQNLTGADFNTSIASELYNKHKTQAAISGDPTEYWKANLSQYGASDALEFFAEAFAEYYEHGDNARQIAKDVGALLEKTIKQIREQG